MKSKKVNFDYTHAKVKDRVLDDVLRRVATEASLHADYDVAKAMAVMDDTIDQTTFFIEGNAVVFDLKLPLFKKASTTLMSFDRPFAHEMFGVAGIEIMAFVLSPTSESAKHLQKLAAVTRFLKSADMRKTLIDAENTDTMKSLLLPDQVWMFAA